jgi:tRNA nucleotidyltransferase (CCA-adding enzyme)
MQIYLVGGAIRDRLLGLPAPFERDWVVVGSTPEEMQSKGFIKVGKSFPVYIDPNTSEEFALARTEKKSGHGYHGFNFNADPEISLEDDLMRRDLTINAIAEDENGNLIDPFNGIEDLNNRILRHVSDAFRDDPLRVLRIARFMAKLSSYGFIVADDTKGLINDIVSSGELDYLVPERIWLETEKALNTDSFCLYFDTLNEFNALEHIYPSLYYAPEENYSLNYKFIDFFKGSEVLPEMRLASIFCALDDTVQIDIIKNFDRIQNEFRFPNSFKFFIRTVMKTFQILTKPMDTFKSSDLYQLLEITDAFRNSENFSKIIYFHNFIDDLDMKKKTDLLNKAFKASKDIGYEEESFKGLRGDKIKEKIDKLRIEKINSIMNSS